MKQRVFWSWLGRKLRAQFFTGFVTIVPLAATVLILYWVFSYIDDILQPIVETIWGRTLTGVGFGATIVIIYLVGIIASNVVGRWLIHRAESALPWVPVFRQLYNGTKQILQGFTSPRETGFMQVVLIEFPRKGISNIGFITNEIHSEPGKQLFTVFVPTSPNPTSGFLQIVEESEIIRTDISVDDALKMIVSAGRISPSEIGDRLLSKIG